MEEDAVLHITDGAAAVWLVKPERREIVGVTASSAPGLCARPGHPVARFGSVRCRRDLRLTKYPPELFSNCRRVSRKIYRLEKNRMILNNDVFAKSGVYCRVQK